MANAKTKAECKPAKSANSEQRFTISQIEQARELGYQAGYRAAMVSCAAKLRGLALADTVKQAEARFAETVEIRVF